MHPCNYYDLKGKGYRCTCCFVFFYISRGIILWIELPSPEYPVNTYARHTETLDSCFDFIRSHQQWEIYKRRPSFLLNLLPFKFLTNSGHSILIQYIYIYIYTNEDYSVNKVNFASGDFNKKHCLQLHSFWGNQLGLVLSCFREL